VHATASCKCLAHLPACFAVSSLCYPQAYLRNNTAIYTAKGVEVVPIVDGCQTNGKMEFHDSCLDKPSGDNYTCAEQRNFGKCDFPWAVSPLAAQWQGGFCQRTCQRCDCSPGSGVQCSVSQINDIDASNAVIHGLNRVLFPPPVFTKEQAIRDAIAFNESVSQFAFELLCIARELDVAQVVCRVLQ
jgi:hypothetical protein